MMIDIQFSHANGFPAKSYEYLFSLLNTKQINFVNTLGHKETNNKNNLQHLVDEIIADVETRLESKSCVDNSATKAMKVIGIGHSSGAAATLFAAAKRPDLFSEVILLDPVIFSGNKRLGIWIAKKLGFWEKLGPTKKALRRRSHFESKQQAHEYFKSKPLFKNFHNRCFDSYVEHGLKPAAHPHKTGVELSFSAQVEADIFTHVPTRIPSTISSVSGTIVYGSSSNVFNTNDVRWWKRHFPNIKMQVFDGGHLFPFEQPDETAELINQLLKTSK